MAILKDAKAEFSCASIGRFANPSDTTCQTYYVCSKKSTGEYVTKNLSCANSQTFDPILGKCSSTYECKNVDTSTTTEATTHAVTQESTSSSTAAPEAPTTEKSTTLSSSTTETSAATEASSTREETTTTSTKTTQESTISSITTAETSSIEATTNVELSSNDDTTTSTAYDTTTEAVEEFVCTETGRFKNPTDKECQTYYLCSIYGSSLIQTLYKCPSKSTFDPDLHRCNVNYVCYNTTESTTTTTTQRTTTTSFEDTPEEPPQADFTCYRKGRFANENDRGCKWYYLCNSLRNGSYIQTPYSCPSNAVFNPEIELCSTLYNCPLQSAITLAVNVRK